MKISLVLVALLVLPGCAYMQDRAKDFGEIWKVQAELGIGARASFRFGDFCHPGIGASGGVTAACIYGHRIHLGVHMEHQFPTANLLLIYVWSDSGGPTGKFIWLIPPMGFLAHESVIYARRGDNASLDLDCPGGCDSPFTLWWENPSGLNLHSFDIEASVFAGLFGLGFGFSPGEFLNFLVGWFGVHLDPKPVEPNPTDIDESDQK